MGVPMRKCVDLQVNGYRGVSFSSPGLTETELAEACRGVLSAGTSAFLPTLVTAAPATYERNLPLLAGVVGRDEFRGRLPGIHLEGPFISPQPGAVGAHNPAWVRPPDVKLFDEMCDRARGTVRLLTVAPEAPGALDLISHAAARGVTVSLGHQVATGEQLHAAVAAGARALTHLGNGLPNLLPRHPNPIWEGLAEDGLVMMVIADGHHLPPATLKSMLRAKGVERSVVVSDAAHLAGMPPGRYEYPSGVAVLEPGGKLHDPEKNCLVGSSFIMPQCVDFLSRRGWFGAEDLDRLVFHNPLKLIGVDPGGIP